VEQNTAAAVDYSSLARLVVDYLVHYSTIYYIGLYRPNYRDRQHHLKFAASMQKNNNLQFRTSSRLLTAVLSFQFLTFYISNFSTLGYTAETIGNDETEFNVTV